MQLKQLKFCEVLYNIAISLNAYNLEAFYIPLYIPLQMEEDFVNLNQKK